LNSTVSEESALKSLSQGTGIVDLSVQNSHQLIKLLLEDFPPILTLNNTCHLQLWSAVFQEALFGISSFSNVKMIGSL